MNVPQVLESSRIGLMVLAGKEDSPLPLEQTTVNAQILGPLNVVAVTQRFSNPLSEAAELEYLFPLPHTAAIVDFELRIGNRVIKSDLQELEQAQAAYENARSEGKRAGLLTERRPDLFAVQIANILPGDTILATMRYQERLVFDDGCYAFVFPMGITPKYHSPGHPDESRGVDAPIAGAGERIGPVEINLSIDAGLSCGDPSSPSHKIEFTRLDDRRISVRLAESSIPDHDFVLRYRVARDGPVLAAWRSMGSDSDYFLATLLPPRSEEEDSDLAPDQLVRASREFIFVLDRSGSMRGGPIGQARNALRACLRTLNPQDQFRLLLFDDRLEWYRPDASQVSQEEVDRADTYLAQVEGRGGTEIIAALEAAFSMPRDEKKRYIVFLTDGAVSADARALDQIRLKIGDARLFTFGIGPSVNRALLTHMAHLGRGTVEFLQLDEDIEGAILRFQDRISFPALTDLSLQWENAKAWDIYPASLPDLFLGQPLEIVGRISQKGSEPAILKVTGLAGKEKIQMQLSLPMESNSEPVIARAWARARVDDLLERGAAGAKALHEIRSEVIGLAFEQRLVTPYTAFVAVDSQAVVTDGKPLHAIHVAQPLPAGLDLSGFLGNYPAPLLAAPPSPMQGKVYSQVEPTSPGYSAKRMLADPSDRSVISRRISKITSDLEGKGGGVLHEAIESQDRAPTSEETLRWLARTQELNGSWEDDLERTAAALLAFLRSGYTTRVGYYRQQIRRAVEWLLQAQPSGTAAFTRAVVLSELARVTGEKRFLQRAQKAVADLPKPATPVEQNILAHLHAPGKVADAQALSDIHNLEELRLAALFDIAAPVPDELLKIDLGRIYASCLNNSH